MTTATTQARQRKARETATALIPRGQHLIDQGADMLILSARVLETPLPVFWADGELAARTDLPARDRDYGWKIDDNYQRALPDWGHAGRISDIHGEDGPWQHYRASLLADELERIPVAVVTVEPLPPASLPVIMPGTTTTANATLTVDERVAALIAPFYRLDSDTGELVAVPLDGDGEAHMAALETAWKDQPPDDPGPEEALLPVAPRTEDPPPGAPGPGSPDQDES
jgi:hypothetical protein